jgi:hypothetical protein
VWRAPKARALLKPMSGELTAQRQGAFLRPGAARRSGGTAMWTRVSPCRLQACRRWRSSRATGLRPCQVKACRRTSRRRETRGATCAPRQSLGRRVLPAGAPERRSAGAPERRSRRSLVVERDPFATLRFAGLTCWRDGSRRGQRGQVHVEPQAGRDPPRGSIVPGDRRIVATRVRERRQDESSRRFQCQVLA